MNDKEWLDRVLIAYKMYQYPNKEVESFIAWLYAQYGVVKPEIRNK